MIFENPQPPIPDDNNDEDAVRNRLIEVLQNQTISFPQFGFFAPENLKGYTDNNIKIMSDEIKAQAKIYGFSLSMSCITRTPIFLYCHKGGRKRGKNSNKCDCEFVICIERDLQRNVCYINMEKTNLTHNHPLKATEAQIEFLAGQTVKDLIEHMLRVKIHPKKIKKLLEQQNIKGITTVHIQHLVRNLSNEHSESETEELINYVKSAGGESYVYSVTNDGVTHRLAVLTILPDEMEKLKQFCDVIFIDSTMTPLKLNWTVTPITLLDKNKQIACGGVLYTSLFTEEVIVWFLETLLSIDFINEKLQTIITDQDAAFVSGFSHVMSTIPDRKDKPIRHVLCALHKFRNFQKKLKALKLPKEKQEALLNLFNIIIHSKHLDEVSEAFAQISTEEALSNYIKKEIEPFLSNFSKPHMKDMFTLGYNVSSVAESMNKLIKNDITNTKKTLLESREHFNSNLRDHYAIIAQKLNTERHQNGYEELYNSFYPAIVNELLFNIHQSNQIIIDEEAHNGYPYTATEGNLQYGLSKESCECYTLPQSGIPCCHLIALHHFLDTNPFELVHSRWKKSEHNPVPEIPEIFDAEDIDFDLPNIPIGGNMENTPTSDFLEFQGMPSGVQFNRVLSACKDLCSLIHSKGISKTFAFFRLIKGFQLNMQFLDSGLNQLHLNFRDILEKIENEFSIENENQDHTITQPDELTPNQNENENEGAIHPDESNQNQNQNQNDTGTVTIDQCDAVGRPKGRPKNQRKTNQFTTNSKCIICLKPHSINDCPFSAFYYAFEQIKPPKLTGRHRCSVCHNYGHKTHDCILRYFANLHKAEHPDTEAIAKVQAHIEEMLRSTPPSRQHNERS